MHKGPVALSAVLAMAVATGSARAQSQTGTAPRYKAQPLNLQKGQRSAAGFAATARTRVRAGDCAGSLDAFDAAIREANDDAGLYRDRGLCHEKLGHPYPAIDDYRVYLTSAPDAPDADGIGQRLTRLEEETSGKAPGTAVSDDTDVPPVSGGASVEVEGGKVTAGASATSRDKLVFVDQDEEELMRSPLRRGKGFSLAPFFAEHKWFFGGASFGDSQTWAECVGAQVRYSVNRGGALVVEAGYEHFNTTNIDQVRASGLTSQVAYELRVPLDPEYDNQVLIAPGIGYEHVVFAPNDPSFQAIAGNAIVPRVRFGWRHMVKDSTALDLALDVGVARWSYTSDSDPGATVVLAALHISLAWGL